MYLWLGTTLKDLFLCYPRITSFISFIAFQMFPNGSVVYLRRLVNEVVSVSIVFGRSKVVLRHQGSWPIACKELVAALTTTELSRQAFEALGLTGCERYFCCDSRNVFQWIKNKDLRLDKFISRREEKILLLSEPMDWRYCPTSLNPADVASRSDSVQKPEARRL